MDISKLSELEIQSMLDTLNANSDNPWVLEDKKLTKTFKFNDFIEAFGFMSSMAIYAEKINHHPEWFNVYGTLIVHLSTHDLAGISKKDFDLATKMEELF